MAWSQDLRYAVRTLRRTPAFTAIAAATLALGIGAATAMFTVLHGISLRDLPVRHADRVAVFWLAPPAAASDHLPLSYRELQAAAQSSRSLERVAGVAFQGAVDAVIQSGDDVMPVAITWVTGDYFPLLDVQPAMGRALDGRDDAPGAARVAVISHALWRSSFAERPDIVGRTFSWNGTSHTIVGVMPRGFSYPRQVQVWMPVLPAFPGTLDPSSPASAQMVFDLVGRVRGTTDLRTVERELQELLARDNTRGASPGALRVRSGTLSSRIIGDVSRILTGASIATGLLLLVACVNVANLLLIRGAARGTELAIRLALGAGRARLVRQLLAEAAVLAALGGAAGIALALAAVRIIVRLAPPSVPQLEMIAVDSRVVLAAAAITMLAAVLAGLLPALMSVRGDPAHWLRGGRGSDASGVRARRVRGALVVGQVAMTVLVVVCAGLVARSLHALGNVDMGFRADNLLIAETALPAGAAADHAQQVALQERLLDAARTLPGVLAATAMPKPPFSAQGGWLATFSGEGQTDASLASNPTVNFEVVGPDYFSTLQVPLVSGRPFGSEDREDRVKVAIVSASLAQRTWPGQRVLGKRIKLGPVDGRGEWLTVVGVAGETRYRELTDTLPTLYLPTRQFPGPVPMTLAIRTSRDAALLLPTLRSQLRALHPDLRIVSGATMQQRQDVPLARPRFSAALLTASAGITLLLALVGVYGTLATTVRERTREIGIRMALGEPPQRARARVLTQGLALISAGCVVGLAVAWYTTRLLRSQLFTVSPTDPVTYVGVLAVMLLCGGLACWIPARRATHVDPVVALRAE
jgi:predicted permease